MQVANKIMTVDPLDIKVTYDKPHTETDQDIAARIADRFDILELLTESCIVGEVRSLIVSGPAGLGKSYTVEHRLRAWDPDEVNHRIVKGYVRATGLIKMLYRYREYGQVLAFDDADNIFFDDVSLNLLKAVCDTTERRRVSWLSEAILVDDETGDMIPKSFDFHGSVIFISNYDFDAMIERGHKLAPHLQALVSRSMYIDLEMRTKRDFIVRIEQVVKDGLLPNHTEDEVQDILDFIREYADDLRELSLRIAIKIGIIRKQSEDWRRIAWVTCCKK